MVRLGVDASKGDTARLGRLGGGGVWVGLALFSGSSCQSLWYVWVVVLGVYGGRCFFFST
jgi:hypothetical protein